MNENSKKQKTNKISIWQKSLPQLFKPGNKRAFLPVRKASLTIEAAIVLPITIMLCVAVIYFLAILSLQSQIQLRIDETGRMLTKIAYMDAEDGTFSEIVANPLLIKAQVFDDSLSDRISNAPVEGGIDGVSTLLSSYSNDTGILDIVVTYSYKIPFLPESIPAMNFLQRMRCRAWIGKQLSESGSPGQDEKKGQTVYITPSGSAYHSSPSCPYLDLSVHIIARSALASARSLNGSRYKRCEICAKSGKYDNVYITDYGTKWHTDPSCPNLKRTVIAVDISEVGSRHACKKCFGSGS